MNDISKMEAGKTLDILVAEKVMQQKFRDEWDNHNNATIACYSTDIAAAWKVFTHWGWMGDITFMGDTWICSIQHGFDPAGYGISARGEGSTAPEAICKAALLAVEDKA